MLHYKGNKLFLQGLKRRKLDTILNKYSQVRKAYLKLKRIKCMWLHYLSKSNKLDHM